MLRKTCDYCHREIPEDISDQPYDALGERSHFNLCNRCWKRVTKKEIKLKEDMFGDLHIDHNAENKCDRCHRERTPEQLQHIVYHEWQKLGYLCEACIDMQERLYRGGDFGINLESNALSEYKRHERYLSIKRDHNSVLDKYHAEEEYKTQVNALKKDLEFLFPNNKK